jgi:hypothetical protein
LTKLREKVKSATSASQQHARDAKAMEARAVMLAGEVDRVKNMLMVCALRFPPPFQRTCTCWLSLGVSCFQEARSTLAYMRKSQNYMASRADAQPAEPVTATVLLSPHHEEKHSDPLEASFGSTVPNCVLVCGSCFRFCLFAALIAIVVSFPGHSRAVGWNDSCIASYPSCSHGFY